MSLKKYVLIMLYPSKVISVHYNKEYQRYQIVRTNTTLLFVDVEQTDYMFDIYT